jgi:hypothetical protein
VCRPVILATFMCLLSTNFEGLNVLEPSEPVQAITETDLTMLYIKVLKYQVLHKIKRGSTGDSNTKGLISKAQNPLL